MAVHTSISTSEIGDKARRELLQLLESVMFIEDKFPNPLLTDISARSEERRILSSSVHSSDL